MAFSVLREAAFSALLRPSEFLALAPELIARPTAGLHGSALGHRGHSGAKESTEAGTEAVCLNTIRHCITTRRLFVVTIKSRHYISYKTGCRSDVLLSYWYKYTVSRSSDGKRGDCGQMWSLRKDGTIRDHSCTPIVGAVAQQPFVSAHLPVM